MLRLFFSNREPHYDILMGMALSRMKDQVQTLPPIPAGSVGSSKATS